MIVFVLFCENTLIAVCDSIERAKEETRRAVEAAQDFDAKRGDGWKTPNRYDWLPGDGAGWFCDLWIARASEIFPRRYRYSIVPSEVLKANNPNPNPIARGMAHTIKAASGRALDLFASAERPPIVREPGESGARLRERIFNGRRKPEFRTDRKR